MIEQDKDYFLRALNKIDGDIKSISGMMEWYDTAVNMAILPLLQALHSERDANLAGLGKLILDELRTPNNDDRTIDNSSSLDDSSFLDR